MTAQTLPSIEEVVEAGFNGRGGGRTPYMDLDNAVSDWTSEVFDKTFERWPCDDDDCPARPAWDKELSEMWGTFTASLNRSVERTIRSRLVKAMHAFAEAHPEATRKPRPATETTD